MRSQAGVNSQKVHRHFSRVERKTTEGPDHGTAWFRFTTRYSSAFQSLVDASQALRSDSSSEGVFTTDMLFSSTSQYKSSSVFFTFTNFGKPLHCGCVVDGERYQPEAKE